MILSKKIPLLIFGFATMAATPAVAQDGASWVDDRGRLMTIQFAGGGNEPPASTDRSVEAMADLFNQICILPAQDVEKMKAVGEALNLSHKEIIPPAQQNAPAGANIWSQIGVIVSQTSGFSIVENPQCNVAFLVHTLPERQAVLDAFENLIGYGPTNSADAFKKNGKPNKRYSPEWVITNDAGQTGTVLVFVIRGNNYSSGDRVQLSISYSKEK